MRLTGVSDEILQSTKPIPLKHQSDAAIRSADSNFEDRRKDKDHAESSGHRQKKNKKKLLSFFDDDGNGEEKVLSWPKRRHDEQRHINLTEA